MIIIVANVATGCATHYMVDRKRDAADVFTVSVGVGAGVKTRIGFLHAGLFAGVDKLGLRGGEVRIYDTDGEESLGSISAECTIFSLENFHYAEDRGKEYSSLGIPLVCGSIEPLEDGKFRLHPFYTQIEVAGGLLGTVRLGFNLGEFVDFFGGWMGVDLYGDDLEARRRLYVPDELRVTELDMVVYEVQKGDTLWSIAYRFYGDGSQYYLIEKANPSMMKDFNYHFKPGMRIVIPKEPEAN